MRKRAGQMWTCDDECNCFQPQIIEYSTDYFKNPDWEPMVTLDRGPFYSEPNGVEMEEMQVWLLDAKRRFGFIET